MRPAAVNSVGVIAWYVRMIRAAEVNAGIDLRPLLALLTQQGISCKVHEESGAQVIWVRDEADAAQVNALLTQWEQLRAEGMVPVQEQRDGTGLLRYFPLGSYLQQLLAAFFSAPVSGLLILAAVAVAVVSDLGNNLQPVSRLFYPGLYPGPDVDMLSFFRIIGQIDGSEELLRMFTPALLHFGAIHLVFNTLWIWHFGRMIEAAQSSLQYFIVVLFIAFVSNTIQYLWSLSVNFGGLSGVVYGLLGYIWMWQLVFPYGRLRLPGSMIAVLLLALVLMEVFASAWIATAAHAGGLFAGMSAGLVLALVTRLRRS